MTDGPMAEAGIVRRVGRASPSEARRCARPADALEAIPVSLSRLQLPGLGRRGRSTASSAGTFPCSAASCSSSAARPRALCRVETACVVCAVWLRWEAAGGWRRKRRCSTPGGAAGRPVESAWPPSITSPSGVAWRTGRAPGLRRPLEPSATPPLLRLGAALSVVDRGEPERGDPVRGEPGRGGGERRGGLEGWALPGREGLVVLGIENGARGSLAPLAVSEEPCGTVVAVDGGGSAMMGGARIAVSSAARWVEEWGLRGRVRGDAAGVPDDPKLAVVAGPTRGLRELEAALWCRWCVGGRGASASSPAAASPGTRKGALRSISMTSERRLPRRGDGRPAGLSVAAPPPWMLPLSAWPFQRDQPFPPLKPSRSASSTAYWRGGLPFAEDWAAPPISLVWERRRVRRCSCRIRRERAPLVPSVEPSSASRAAASTSDTSSPALNAALAMAVSSSAPGEALPAGEKGATPVAAAACRPGGACCSLITAVARSLSSASPPEAPILMRRACGRRDGSAIARLRLAAACFSATGRPARGSSAGNQPLQRRTRAGSPCWGPRERWRPVLEQLCGATAVCNCWQFGLAALQHRCFCSRWGTPTVPTVPIGAMGHVAHCCSPGRQRACAAAAP